MLEEKIKDLVNVNEQMASEFNKLYTLLLANDLVELTPAVAQRLGRIIEDFYRVNLCNYGIDRHSSPIFAHLSSLQASDVTYMPRPNLDSFKTSDSVRKQFESRTQRPQSQNNAVTVGAYDGKRLSMRGQGNPKT